MMIDQLNQRERVFVGVGAAALLLGLLYFAVVIPYQSSLARLDQQLAARSRQLQEVKTLQSRYLALQQQMAQMERQLGSRQDFSALSFVESLVEQTAGRENLVSMRPQPATPSGEYTVDAVEIKLEKLTFRQVLELLWGLETANTPMQVKDLHLKQRFDAKDLLDATLTVTALRRTA